MAATLKPTPRLVAVRRDIESNIAAMARYAAKHHVALRPHAKSHKSPDIARLQVSAGAVGVCCATVAEIEAMARAGIRGLVLTSPIAPDKAPRVAAAHAGGDVIAVVDGGEGIHVFAAASGNAARPLRLLVDIDVGQHRTGTRTAAETVMLARRIAGTPGLAFAGIQAYAGHAQHVTEAVARRRIARNCAETLKGHIEALREGFQSPAIVTGSGTGCFADDMGLGVYTEVQVGSYVVMDSEYRAVEPSSSVSFKVALFVEATVIGDRFEGSVLVDAGQKALFSGGPQPVLAGERGKRLRYAFAGDEHGQLSGAPGDLPRPGERVRFELPHCDPNVVLFDHIDVEEDGQSVDVWPVVARGSW